MIDTTGFDSHVLTTPAWQERARAHLARVSHWTIPHKERRSRQERHPVFDFLFQYYMYSPGKLEAWHPEAGEALADSPEAREQFCPPNYQASDGLIRRDPSALSDGDRKRHRSVVELLEDTQRRRANLACFGVHEWAMVYGGHEVRHGETVPLRLPQREVDAFVDTVPVVCSHFDALRFFAPKAKPLNRMKLQWETRHQTEQPGCLHANMDLYRWAYEAMPWIGSELLWQSFELATHLRVLDMQASPNDLAVFDLEPIRVETPEGRARYQERQLALAARAQVIRSKLIEALGSDALWLGSARRRIVEPRGPRRNSRHAKVTHSDGQMR